MTANTRIDRPVVITALFVGLGLGCSNPSHAADSKPAARSPEPTPPAAAEPAGKALRLPAPATDSLGDADTLSIAPRTKVKSSPLEALKPRQAKKWTEGKRTPVTLGTTAPPLELVTLTYPGEAAAVSVLAPAEGGFKVVGTYVVYQGGNGAEIEVAKVLPDPSGAAAFALLAISKEFRGFEGDGKKVAPSSDRSFAVLAFTRDQAWLGTDQLNDLTSAVLESAAGVLRVVGCAAKKTPHIVLALNPASARLEKAPAAAARNATCPTKPR